MTKRNWLIILRNRRNLTQQQVAAEAYIDRSYYVQIENGTRNPSSDVARKIAEVIDFHYSSFEIDENPFELALKHSPIIVAHCDTELRYTWIFNPHPTYDCKTVLGRTDGEINSNEGSLALMALKREVLDKCSPVRREIAFPVSDGNIYFDIFGHLIYNDNNRLIGVATVATRLQKLH